MPDRAPQEYFDFERIREMPVYKGLLAITTLGYLAKNRLVNTPEEKDEVRRQIRDVSSLDTYLELKGWTEHKQAILDATDGDYRSSTRFSPDFGKKQ